MSAYQSRTRLPFVVSIVLICGYNVFSSAMWSNAPQADIPEVYIEQAPAKDPITLASAEADNAALLPAVAGERVH